MQVQARPMIRPLQLCGGASAGPASGRASLPQPGELRFAFQHAHSAFPRSDIGRVRGAVGMAGRRRVIVPTQKAGKSNAITTSAQTHRPSTSKRLAGLLASLVSRFGSLPRRIIIDAPGYELAVPFLTSGLPPRRGGTFGLHETRLVMLPGRLHHVERCRVPRT
jgi:hypothetical protein